MCIGKTINAVKITLLLRCIQWILLKTVGSNLTILQPLVYDYKLNGLATLPSTVTINCKLS